MPSILTKEALELFTQNIGFFILIILLLIVFAAIQNFDKLSGPFGKKRRWEAEKARLETNHKYWELVKYKRTTNLRRITHFKVM